MAGDEGRAREWLSYEDPFRSFKPVKELVDDVIGKGRGTNGSESIYRVYRNLCVPKHVNPVLEQWLGADFSEGAPVLRNGPDTGEDAQSVAWYALENGSRTAAFALRIVVDGLLTQEAAKVLEPEFVSIHERCRELDLQTKERGWWTA